ncbi:uncharacterized protein Z520_02323 [Fonsecaea multimorphosa CBS 102226]|uniref:Uncharacterized protein n=1 Tax=Fonsecaea multimorphosa CBS 102226 TaxID=1442371 RepID=A0A0D2KFE8_9EURO|nr:uncharacterized protein Z520_02323 [Fonsecaea multimorphosa CBS 102226]KIY02185.1 hypothetical protein Z520_02323 [Fonsecaea multimorphosa CBS 102226]OAL29378.1 hypothetical protein AYO22_02272 [Fonsecaea multimorphosa]
MNFSRPSEPGNHPNGVTNGSSTVATNGVANGTTSIPKPGLRYGMFSNWKPHSQKKDDREEALEVIRNGLPKMTRVKAVLGLDIGLDSGPIYIDTREEPRILQTFDGEPDCHVKIKPRYIIAFAQGQLEPRFALFKDGFFDKSTLPKGDIKVAVKFGDALCPVDPVNPVSPKPGSRLPTPTEDIDQVRRDLKEFGYGLVKNALTRDQVEVLAEAVRQQGRGEMEAGVAARDGGPNTPNQRIWTLINKGQEFLDLLEHPLIDEVIPENLGDNFLVHSYSANIARPGNDAMMLHTDQVGIQPPVRNLYFGINIMWFLTDITAENGGTRVFPGSHLGAIAPDGESIFLLTSVLDSNRTGVGYPGCRGIVISNDATNFGRAPDPFNIDGTVAAEGPAGTALVFESRLWHATGPNKMTSGERPVILMFFMRSFIRQQENNFLSIRPEVEASMSDRVRKMLGWCADGAFGGIEGEIREGQFVKKLANPFGPFRDSHRYTPFRMDMRAKDVSGVRTAELVGNRAM